MDVHFNSYKAKYDVLDACILPIKRSQIIKTLNIYVSLDDLFHTLHKPSVNTEFQSAGQDAAKQFISNIFNLLGHYRYWAVRHQHYKCKVIGYHTTTLRTFKNNMYIPNYRKHFKEINDDASASNYFVNSTIRDSIPLIEVISRYIPDIYIVNSKYMEPSTIPFYLNTEIFPADWNILISRDTYDIQYVYKDKWSVIAPRGEYTTNITLNNMWDYVNMKERIYTDNIEPLTYPYELYDLAKALVGDKYRSIPRLRKIGWKTLFKYFDEVLEIHEGQSMILCKEKLLDLIKAKKLTNEEVNNNLNALDVELQIASMLELDKEMIKMQLIDVPDYENLKMINKDRFYSYPLNLQFLTDNASSTQNKSQSIFGF